MRIITNERGETIFFIREEWAQEDAAVAEAIIRDAAGGKFYFDGGACCVDRGVHRQKWWLKRYADAAPVGMCRTYVTKKASIEHHHLNSGQQFRVIYPGQSIYHKYH